MLREYLAQLPAEQGAVLAGFILFIAFDSQQRGPHYYACIDCGSQVGGVECFLRDSEGKGLFLIVHRSSKAQPRVRVTAKPRRVFSRSLRCSLEFADSKASILCSSLGFMT